MSASALTEPLTLPCGLRLENRLGRAAMTEGIAGPRNDPNERHVRLYAANARGGAGLVLTGNVMVDRRHLERARNIVIDSATDQAALERWAQSAAATPTLVQLSHPGRQVNRFIQSRARRPLRRPRRRAGGLFNPPRALTVGEIEDVRDRFIAAGERVVAAGFAGVEVHAAHGYLLSSFLDPAINHRSDDYGGGLQGRARLLLEIVRRPAGGLAPGAAIAVKLDARDGRRRGARAAGGPARRAGRTCSRSRAATTSRPR